MKQYVNKEMLLQLIKTSKITVNPKYYNMFVEDLNDVISFCDSIRSDFNTDDEESSKDSSDNFMTLLEGNEVVNVYRHSDPCEGINKIDVWENNDKLESGYISLKRSDVFEK